MKIWVLFPNLASGGLGTLFRMLSIQKNEKITRTVPILKLNSIFFSRIDIKKIANGVGPGVMLSIQKNEKITRKIPILKPNST